MHVLRNKSYYLSNYIIEPLQGCSYKNSFLVVFLLNGQKIFPGIDVRNSSLSGRDLFWQAVKWENFSGNKHLKRGDKNLTIPMSFLVTSRRKNNCLGF